ncbi:CdaR family transcriptional regulator [Aquibacillus salsiterrae]|uniref:Helix-turn-helix domain-containing protein n=1 Tax=Aquibacillus salsiterrae TaxID=2950439 RepID=A0A9X3WJP9_9BACI|nr:sugar diacid recognition domain-containing protein [Aquibacillus salsiterrae]MDC3418321.1 helix-turn-helix domain-containing protein [Aquibacillus salsiterrae]
MLTTEIANEIVKQTMVRLNRNINIMDQSGKIIASGNQQRIGHIHEGSLEVLQTGKTVVLKEGTNWRGALPGINLPIEFQNKIIGVIGITGNPTDISEFGELTKMITEMMVHQAFWANKVESKQRIKEMVFEELLHGRKSEQRLAYLNIDLKEPFHVGVMEIGETKLNMLRLIQMIEESLGPNSLVGFSGANRLFLLFSGKASADVNEQTMKVRDILEKREISSRIGLGSSVMGVDLICQSHEQATNALMFGQRDRTITRYEEIEINALLSQLSDQETTHFTHRILGSLPEKWIDTLSVFFQMNQNIGASAESLFIHRNTMIYRLKQIKEQTGLDPQNFQDAVTLQIAIWMRN